MAQLTIKQPNRMSNMKTFRQLAQVKRIGHKAVRSLMTHQARDIVKEARRSRKDPKTGRLYFNVTRRLLTGRLFHKARHRASASGQSHADIAGEVRGSLGYTITGSRYFIVGYGGGKGKNGPPKFVKALHATRPTILNAIRQTNGNAQKHWNRLIRRAMR